MAKDKETTTRAEEVQKERQARIEKLIKTLEAGADKDDQKFRRVEKLDKERIKLAQKEEKFEDLGQKLWKSTFGGMFKGMTGIVPEPIKILGRMVGVAFGAKGRIKKKKKKLLAKAYKRAAKIGLDTAGWEEKTPESLEEIVENAEILHDIKMPEEPKVEKAEGKPYDPIGWLLGKGPSGEVPGEEPGESAALGEGAFASSPVIEKLTEISNSLTTLVELGGGEGEGKAEPGEEGDKKPGLLSRMGSKVSGMAKSVKSNIGKGMEGIFGSGEEGDAGASMTGGEGGLSEAANDAIIDLSAAALSPGSIFVHDLQAFEFLKSTMDTPAEKKEKQVELAAETKRGADRWEKLFKILRGMPGGDSDVEGGGGGIGGFFKSLGMVKILKGLGSILGGAAVLKYGLPGAIILWGITAAIFIVKDWIRGFKEGGITGGIGQALGGAGEGLMNAFKQSIKWGGIGATIGMIVGSVVPGFGTLVGALIGGLIGMALGALFGFIGGDKITKGLNKAGEAVARGWKAMMKWLGDTTKAIGNWFFTPKSKHPDHPDPARVMGMALEWPQWMVKAAEKIKAGWNATMKWLSELPAKISRWIYSPEGTHPDHPSPAKLFGISLVWPEWMKKAGAAIVEKWNAMTKWFTETITKIGHWIWNRDDSSADKAGELFGITIPTWSAIGTALTTAWDKLTTWATNLVTKIGAWIYTGQKTDVVAGKEFTTGAKIFGVQLPALPSPGEAISAAWNKIVSWVTDIGKWFWNKEKGTMFGKFPIPTLSLPDINWDAIIQAVMGKVAGFLSKIPFIERAPGMSEFLDKWNPGAAAVERKGQAEERVEERKEDLAGIASQRTQAGTIETQEIEKAKDEAVRLRGGKATQITNMETRVKKEDQNRRDELKQIELDIVAERDKISRSEGGENVYGTSAENIWGREGEGRKESLETIGEKEARRKELQDLKPTDTYAVKRLASLQTELADINAQELQNIADAQANRDAQLLQLNEKEKAILQEQAVDLDIIAKATTIIANQATGTQAGAGGGTTGGVNKSVKGSTAAGYTPSAGGGVSQSSTKKVSGQGNITRLKVGDEGLSKENLARKGTDEFDSQAGVAEAFAPQFQGFVQDLLATGYKINYFGGYRKSDVAGSDKASWHQSGMAIDINKDKNPMYKPANKKVGPDTPGAKPLGRDGRWIITDMPDNIYEIAQKWGLGWGGKWLNTVDAMHFSVASKEGGSVASEDVTRGMVPILAAAQGLVGFVKKPTLILAGEKGPESVNIRPSTLTQQAGGLMPGQPVGGGGTVIVNNSGNSNLATKNVNTQLNQDPGWAVFHTPVYRRGGYAA